MNKNYILGKIINLAVILAVLVGSTSVMSSAVYAADDYPYANKVYGRYSNSDIDPYSFWYRECTSFVAYRLNSRNGINFSNWYKGIRWSHAANWHIVAKELGFTVDNTPAVGAVAYWANGSHGHVAWVSAVKDGVVTVEDYNNKGDGKYGTGNIPQYRRAPDGYIHIKDIETVQEKPQPIFNNVNFTSHKNYDTIFAGSGDVTVTWESVPNAQYFAAAKLLNGEPDPGRTENGTDLVAGKMQGDKNSITFNTNNLDGKKWVKIYVQSQVPNATTEAKEIYLSVQYSNPTIITPTDNEYIKKYTDFLVTWNEINGAKGYRVVLKMIEGEPNRQTSNERAFAVREYPMQSGNSLLIRRGDIDLMANKYLNIYVEACDSSKTRISSDMVYVKVTE